MSHALRVGVADQIGYFRAYNTDGSAKTDLTSSTTGLALSVFRVGAAAVSISSLSAKAADNTAHADGAIRAVSGNLYTVDLPDAACADQVPSISVKGSYTGGVIEGPEHPLVGYNPASVAVGANTTTPPTVGAIADQVWDEARSGHVTAGTFGEKVNAELDSDTQTQITAIETFATRMTTGLVQNGLAWQFTASMLELGPSSSGGDATLAKQEEILAAIQGSEVIQVASPNVQGNLVLTQGDSYDGIANQKAQWTVTTDYTDGWSVALTIRDKDDAVVYTTTGEVVSSTVVAVAIIAPTGLTMTGCPGQWQGKFDVQLTKAGSVKTIALGVCYINEDQTR